MVFRNQSSPEIFQEYGQWLPFIVDVYAPIKDSENGDFRFLPYPGTILDQPYWTMLVLKEIQNTYREVVKEENEKALKKKN